MQRDSRWFWPAIAVAILFWPELLGWGFATLLVVIAFMLVLMLFVTVVSSLFALFGWDEWADRVHEWFPDW